MVVVAARAGIFSLFIVTYLVTGGNHGIIFFIFYSSKLSKTVGAGAPVLSMYEANTLGMVTSTSMGKCNFHQNVHAYRLINTFTQSRPFTLHSLTAPVNYGSRM